MKKIWAILLSVAMLIMILSGCGSSNGKEEAVSTQKDDVHLTVYLWEITLFDEFAAYVKEQCPDVEIEFIAGNNNVFLYDYLEKHGELPDIITTRRFSAADAKNLSPYLIDLSAYDVVSSFYPYILQYYTNTDGEIQWLPVCGIPETMIINKTLFDQYGIAIPESYDEFVQTCAEFKSIGLKPYVCELSKDWAAHTLIQAAAIDNFSGIDGILWRSKAESADGEIPFEEKLWMDIFHEVNTFAADTGLEESDLQQDGDDVRAMFAGRKAAMFRGTPSVVEELKTMTDDELVRLPYFSQTSDESWVYTYPSLNIALNSSLEQNEEKQEAAMKVLNCFLSQEGQEYIACGQGMISYNVGVESDMSGMEGVKDELDKNAIYIRYASNNSFLASLEAINGLLSGKMDEKQAFETFENGINASATEEDDIVKFEKTYKLSVNENNGRDAASSILTTARESTGADIAITAYYSYASSIYEGGCTKRELSMIVNTSEGIPLYVSEVAGGDIRSMVEAYLQDTGSSLRVTDKYELPVVSGMKLILTETENGYQVKDIEVDGDSIKDDQIYRLLFSEHIQPAFDRVCQNSTVESVKGELSGVWQAAIGGGQKPAEP